MTAFRPLPPIPAELLHFNPADWPEPARYHNTSLLAGHDRQWATLTEHTITTQAEERARGRWHAAQRQWATRHRATLTDFHVAAAEQRTTERRSRMRQEPT